MAKPSRERNRKHVTRELLERPEGCTVSELAEAYAREFDGNGKMSTAKRALDKVPKQYGFDMVRTDEPGRGHVHRRKPVETTVRADTTEARQEEEIDMPEEKEKLQSVIRDELTNVLGRSAIQDVHVKPDYGYDGDPVLRIVVLSNWKSNQLSVKGDRIVAKGIDADKLLEVIRRLRTTLGDLGVDALPVISYIAKDEIKQIENAL